MSILITGGCGYIGSHLCVELLNNNYQVVIIDNLTNSYPSVLDGIHSISNKHPIVYNFDICDVNLLSNVFEQHKPDTVIHLAGHKSIIESISSPSMYYENNVNSTSILIQTMEKYNCRKFIFSSTAAVYSPKLLPPFDEECDVNPSSPYGSSKLIIEDKLKQLKDWNIIVLRYFNPIGCHPSGLIKENPKKEYKNVIPILIECVEKNEPFSILGNDYNTRDGTTIRDYIDVCDIAKGHLQALKNLHKHKYEIINLGSGTGVTLLELIKAVEQATNTKIDVVNCERRDGDSAQSFSDITKATTMLNWKPTITIEESCKHLFVK